MCSSETTENPCPPTGSGSTSGPAASCPFSATMITPAGDPAAAPNFTQGADGQNEFTFSTATPGVLTMNLKALVTPAGRAASLRDSARFQVDTIGASTLAWDAANPDGKPTVNGDFFEATVTFTGLPANNSDLGLKEARLLVDGQEFQSQYEVFFPRDAKNHPGAGAGTTPNWFFYWEQVVGVANMVYEAGGGSGLGEVKGMLAWTYTAAPDKTHVYVHDPVVSRARSYGVGEECSGIDRFAMTAVHESRHVDQIARADGLVPSTRCWQYGYSWNQAPHNHWSAGPDAAWGPTGVAIGTLPTAPPFPAGPGGGDDVDLDDRPSSHWPNAWGARPARLSTIHPIEGDAVEFADSAVSEDDYADRDWGDPGKNHNTLLKFDD